MDLANTLHIMSFPSVIKLHNVSSISRTSTLTVLHERELRFTKTINPAAAPRVLTLFVNHFVAN